MPLRTQAAFVAQGQVCGRYGEPVDCGAGVWFGRAVACPVAGEGASVCGTQGAFGAVVAVSGCRVWWAGCGMDGCGVACLSQGSIAGVVACDACGDCGACESERVAGCALAGGDGDFGNQVRVQGWGL
jgi:hypothetical protein